MHTKANKVFFINSLNAA